MSNPENNNIYKTKRRVTASIIVFALLMLIYYRYYQRPVEYTFSGSVMGTSYHVKYLSKRLSEARQREIATKVSGALHRIDNKMSTYKPASELMKFNAWPVNKPFPVSSDLAGILQESKKISVLSHGAYDVTIGNLVNLWGFGPYKNSMAPAFIAMQKDKTVHHIPSNSLIKKAKNESGYQYLEVDVYRKIVTKKKKMFVDLSSIAKGYGVDVAARSLKESGIANYMVEVGGEIHVEGNSLNKEPWRIAIRSPVQAQETPYKTIYLKNEGMATSGDYLNYYDVNHIRYSHEIDPRTGYPKANNIASVTVIAPNTTLADAYSTMFMILKPEEGRALADKLDLAVYFIYRMTGDHGFTTYATPSFQKFTAQRG